MSETAPGGRVLTDEQRNFLGIVQDTFEPHLKSEQCRDHPETSFPEGTRRRHNDGDAIYQGFGIPPTHKFLWKATRQDHAVSKYPQAFAHFVTHLRQWEKWEISEEDPDFSEVNRIREKVLRWYAGLDPETPADERADAHSRRSKRLRPGGTGIILHGEQGTTKTTAMHWLVSHIMQVNQQENVIWQSTLDDTEWQVFGPWATMCIPSAVEVDVVVNPYSRQYRDIEPFEISPEDVCREVIRYDDPVDLTKRIADREPGQFYVVYPDPRFRKCQALTGWPYENIWEVTSSAEATDLNHYWFGLMEALHHGSNYNEWTTVVGDEAHKWLRQGASDDQHKWHKKIDDWATYWGDARKERLSVILAVHKWHELHHYVRDKVRWGATMNGEEFPSDAPINSGKNTYDQDLGDMCMWNNMHWNHVGYPDIKRNFSVPATISVEYPTHQAEVEAKS